MAQRTFELYAVQSPSLVRAQPDNPGEDSKRDFLNNLLKAWHGSVAIHSTIDLVSRITLEATARRAYLRKLVIGAHGRSYDHGYASVRIGRDILDRNSPVELNQLRMIVPFLARDAQVFIFSCRVGIDAILLSQISNALGGTAVHGYTDYVTATDYLFWATASDETDDGANEIVCVRNMCWDISAPRPDTFMPPPYVTPTPPWLK